MHRLPPAAGVQYILPSAAVWRLAQRRPQEPAEALQIISAAQTDGPAAARLTPADAQQVSTRNPSRMGGTIKVASWYIPLMFGGCFNSVSLCGFLRFCIHAHLTILH